jgi:hypothetical protein
LRLSPFFRFETWAICGIWLAKAVVLSLPFYILTAMAFILLELQCLLSYLEMFSVNKSSAIVAMDSKRTCQKKNDDIIELNGYSIGICLVSKESWASGILVALGIVGL